jgi:tetratricopeptide (TPR) repeat protein
MLPLLFASVNWPSFEGDLNAGAHNLTRGLFRFIHIVFLGLTVLMFFTTNYSPNPQRMGLPGLLSFNYLAALSVGYFSGYVLVVFGQQVIHRWARATGILLGINRVVVVALWAAAVALPVMLFVKNRPHVQAINSEVIPEFAKLMVQAVPEKQTFLLGDDPIRLHLAAAALQKEGKLDQFVVIETQSLPYPPYLRFLAQRYPTIRSMGVDPDKIPNLISTEQLADLVFHIAQHAPVYYLHPSVGYFFERSHMVPRGLGGDIQPYTTISNAVLVQVMNPGEIRTNQAFWRAAKAEVLAPLTNAAKLSSDASRLAVFYSQDLNDWGVELQKSGTIFKDTNMLRDAGDQFADALLLNPQNFLARFNMQYNARLRGLPPPPAAGQMVSAEELSSRVGNWLPLLNTDGLPDEPDLDLKIGRQMAQSRDLFQSAQFFQRCLQLRTNNLEAELDLAKTYIDLGQYTLDQALEIIRQIRARSATVSEEVVRVEATAYTKQGRLEEADDLLAREQAKHPKEEKFLAVLVQYYRVMGYSAMHSGRADLSQKYFLKSLNAIQEQLQALNSPSAPSSSATAIPETMLVKAELQMLLKQYDQAIDTLTRLVQLDPKSPLPLLNRAIAQLQEGKLEAAKTDYLTLAKLASDNPSYMVYYGLADIAQKQANKPDAIKYFKLYKEYAPRGTPEYTNVLQQLQKLEGH